MFFLSDWLFESAFIFSEKIITFLWNVRGNVPGRLMEIMRGERKSKIEHAHRLAFSYEGYGFVLQDYVILVLNLRKSDSGENQQRWLNISQFGFGF